MDETTVRKAFKYKLQPTSDQEETMAFVVRRCRELYNAALQERRDAWHQCGVSISAAHQGAELPDIKEVRPEYHDVHSPVLQDVLTRLDRAFQAFFRRVKSAEQPGYPRFQGATATRASPTSSMAMVQLWTMAIWSCRRSGVLLLVGPAR